METSRLKATGLRLDSSWETLHVSAQNTSDWTATTSLHLDQGRRPGKRHGATKRQQNFSLTASLSLFWSPQVGKPAVHPSSMHPKAKCWAASSVAMATATQT